ncbi:TylF/MycF/NovP-related O-methyltransferase [Amycolatopsis australiensis]|uniref:O-methyltransferase n=1 Tax=Amycolatopsis australiensis TaxID=546364 RepID=A0A1K1RL21_9PSEU|nr:TylF/MycF/NovP-related O-methyltransferase [Amycolatopsis australiensis]SFW72540.1 O-methyltransferase [Amycolatopsis australiensis]
MNVKAKLYREWQDDPTFPGRDARVPEPAAGPRLGAAGGLYLELLKKVLTGTLASDEPDIDDARFLRDFIDHYITGNAYTMVPRVRLDNIQACIADVVERRVPGDFIETGVWRGGTTIFMRGMLAALGCTDRRVWVADSFQGLPEPDAEKFPAEAKAHASSTMTDAYQHFAVSRADVEANFAAFGLLDAQVRFLEGWFKDTLPTAPVERLAVIRLDGDYYESTMDALTSLYDKLSPGGYVVVDDYGEDLWTYCRKAVDDFRRDRGLTGELTRVDSKCYYWRRED